MKSMYPSSFPEFANQPNGDAIEVVFVNGEVQQGLRSIRGFLPGEIVFRFTGIVSPEPTQHSLRLADSLHIHDPWVMGKVLHSCDPNMRVDMATLTFFATKLIGSGELLTMDYASTEEYLFKCFVCQCGSNNCREFIRGTKQ